MKMIGECHKCSNETVLYHQSKSSQGECRMCLEAGKVGIHRRLIAINDAARDHKPNTKQDIITDQLIRVAAYQGLSAAGYETSRNRLPEETGLLYEMVAHVYPGRYLKMINEIVATEKMEKNER